MNVLKPTELWTLKDGFNGMWNLSYELYLLKKETESPIQLQSRFNEKTKATICCLDRQFKQTQMGHVRKRKHEKGRERKRIKKKKTHHENNNTRAMI